MLAPDVFSAREDVSFTSLSNRYEDGSRQPEFYMADPVQVNPHPTKKVSLSFIFSLE